MALRNWRTMFDTRTEATRTIGGYIDRFYNPTRHHSALAFSRPIKYEMMALAAAQVF